MYSPVMSAAKIKRSKFLSLVLRHNPSIIGLELGSNGWVSIEKLSQNSQQSKQPLSVDEINEIAASNEKKRFTISEDGLLIRAAQGHSLGIELNLEPTQPPEILYHGTAEKFIEAIKLQGLLPMTRDYVHLSKDTETALKVGSRHGKPRIIKVSAFEMATNGYKFFRAENGVWLVKEVPANYLDI